MAALTLTRRSVFRGAVLTVAAGVVGFVVARNSNAAKPSASSGTNGYGPSTGNSGGGQRLVGLDQVPVGGGVILDGPNVVVVRSSPARVHGLSAICTHQGCTVSNISRGVISCPCHGSRFSAATGAVLSGPAPRPLPAIALDVRNGEVYEA